MGLLVWDLARSSSIPGKRRPVVYKGIMYVITGADEVSAMDVKNGDILWTYKPDIEDLDTVCCGWTSRGVAVGDGMVYVASS